MATTTTNYGFTLPDKTDFYDITQYNDTVTEIDELLNIAQASYESAVLAASEAVTAAENAIAAVETIETHATTATEAAATATTAAEEAQTYYENTQTLSIANVGDVTFSINAAKNCLTAYVASDDDVDVSDWYTEFLALLSEYVSTVQTNANSAETSATTATTAATAAAESAESAASLAESTEADAATASEAATEATAAAESALTYYQATKQLSIANVGEITLSINEAKKCLSATYSDDDTDDE